MTAEPLPVAATSGPPVDLADTPLTTDARVAADHARHAARQPSRLVATLLRTKSVAGRAVLAVLAGGPDTTAQQLEDLGRRVDAGELTAAEAAGGLAAPDARRLCEYARVAALQLSDPAGISAGLGLYAMADALSGGQHPRDAHADLWAQLLLVRGQGDDARHATAVLDRGRGTEDTTAFSHIDLLNPHRPQAGPTADDHAWWEAFSGRLGAGLGSIVRLASVDELFDREWLARHGLDADTLLSTPFDRLLGEGGTPVDHPYRVSVIMSAHNPGPKVLLAARSLVSQTWQNWELLVVDDASPEPTPGILEAIEELDPRIQVIRKAVNGGTYRCRNTAIRRATGDAIVVLDSDDWAHPELLEAGVRPLLDPADPLHTARGVPEIATRQLALRIGDDLRITRPGYRGAIPCAPSLMVPMVPGVARVGFFDPVRKAADTEYARRLEAATGRPVRQSRHVLVLMRTDASSLSAADFSLGWRHSARHEYKNAYAGWHARIAAGEDPWLEPDGPPQIAGPRRWSSALRPPGSPRPHLDAVFAGDWRRYGGPQRSMLEEIHSLLEAGLEVGVMHLEALRFMRTTDDPLCAPLQELLDAGRVRMVHLDDAVDIDVLLLRYPPILQYPPSAPKGPDGSPTGVRPRTLVIVANQAPAEVDGSDQRYAVGTVERNARELFGTDPLWAPQGPSIRRLLQRETSALTPWDDPGLVDLASWRTRDPEQPPAATPVVGRYSRDDRIKFPTEWETLRAAYDFGPRVHVRMMGAPMTVQRLKQEARTAGLPVEAPSSPWELLKHGSQDVQDFLAGIDVFVYVDNPHAHEAFGRTLLEAAASGVPVVATPKHRDTFGDLLLYAEPHEVPQVVHELLTVPGLYRQRVEHQLAVVAERYSREAFAAHVDELRDEAAPEAGTGAGSDPADAGAPQEPLSLTVRTTDDPRLPLAVELGAGAGAVTRVLPLRRPADGERADALAAVGSEAAVQAALTAHLDALAAGHGERAALEAAHRIDGLRALVLLRDGEIACLVPQGTTSHPQGWETRLELPAGPPTTGLVWRTAQPAPGRVTVAPRPQAQPAAPQSEAVPS